MSEPIEGVPGCRRRSSRFAASEVRILQMLNGHWAVQLMSDVTRMGVPDALKAHGPMMAREMVSRGFVPAHPEALGRAMRRVLPWDSLPKMRPVVSI